MAVRVIWQDGGPYALCDTPEEAARLLQLGSGDQGKGASANATTSAELACREVPDEGETMTAILTRINGNARNFLRVLLGFPGGVSGRDFETAVGIGAVKWGGTIGGISKIAKKSGVPVKKLIISEFRAEGSRRYRWLKPGPLLLKHRQKLPGKEEALAG